MAKLAFHLVGLEAADRVSQVLDTVADNMKGKPFFTKDSLDKVLPFATSDMQAALEKFPYCGCSLEVLGDLMRVILIDPGRYFYYGKSAKVARRVKHVTKDTCSDYTVFLLLIATGLWIVNVCGNAAATD